MPFEFNQQFIKFVTPCSTMYVNVFSFSLKKALEFLPSSNNGMKIYNKYSNTYF